MLADEWEKIKLVFEAALSMPEERRLPYVKSACGGDTQREAIVAELLANHAGAGRFLETVTVRIRPVFSADELVAARFRIVRLIGDGGMGEVYEAFDERLRVRVALKTLRADLASDPQALERFRREVLVAREVSHESVCKIFDLIDHSDAADSPRVPCLTMQLIEGESLLNYLQARRPLSPPAALPLIRQIAGAIDALHAYGIIHRDLKPSNIMLTTRNGRLRAVVTDFGLSRPATHAETLLFESRPEHQAGAPYFMAPELLRGGRPTAASDIYAFGLIIDEMVTASRAFPAESLHNLYYQKLWEQPVPPSSRAPALPPQWERVILRAVASEPGDRYTSAGEVLSELELPEGVEARTPVPGTVEVDSPGPAPKRLTWKLPWRRRTRIAVGAGVLAVAAAAGAARSLVEPLNTSLLVFPIENLSNRKDLDYICKGIGAELMRQLALLDGVQVIPYYEPRSQTALGMLKGQFSLEGLLQASGNRIRLTAQLTENRSGTLLWSQNFDREMQNPLQLQTDLAEGSVRALEARAVMQRPIGIGGSEVVLPAPLVRLLGFQRVTLPRPPTSSSAAFDYYLRGRSLFEERTVPAALDAIRSYESALREDPKFALAQAGIAETQFVLLDYDYEPAGTLVARANQSAQAAIRLDPKLAEGYTALAAVRESVWDFKGAERAYRRALEANPRFSRAHRWYAGLILQFGRYDEALEEMRKALALDPYDYPAQSNQGFFLYLSRRYQEALAQLRETLTHKDLIGAHNFLGDIYFQLALESAGSTRRDYLLQAIEQADLVEDAMRKSMAEAPPPAAAVSIKWADRMHAEYFTALGEPERAKPYLDRLIADATAGRTSPVPLAMYYAVSGDAEKAMPLLERAADHNDRQLLFLKVYPQFDHIRESPEFQKLLKKLGY